MVQQTLATFAQNMQKCFAPGTEGYNSLADTTKKLQPNANAGLKNISTLEGERGSRF